MFEEVPEGEEVPLYEVEVKYEEKLFNNGEGEGNTTVISPTITFTKSVLHYNVRFDSR